MMKDVSVITGNSIPSDISVGTAGEQTIKTMGQSESVIKISDCEEAVPFNRVLYMQDFKHSLVSVSSLYEDAYSGGLDSRTCIVKI